MSGPIKLVVPTPPRDGLRDVVVRMLEELLERARRGEVESLLLMYETTDFDGMQWGSAGTLNRSQTVGRIEILKAVLVRELLDGDQG